MPVRWLLRPMIERSVGGRGRALACCLDQNSLNRFQDWLASRLVGCAIYGLIDPMGDWRIVGKLVGRPVAIWACPCPCPCLSDTLRVLHTEVAFAGKPHPVRPQPSEFTLRKA
jgi:hypothetical protein